VPEWKDDPADEWLGPWVVPSNLRECVASLRALRRRLQRRRVVLGLAYLLIRANDLWKEVPGCRSLEELCRVHLVVGQRSFQRYAREGLEFLRRPWLRREVEKNGLTIDRAMFAVGEAGDSDLALRSWIELLRRLGGAEFERVRESDGDVRKEYGPALAMARAVETALHRGDEPGATAIGGTAARIADHLREVGATGPIQIALRDASRRSRPREPDFILAPPRLLEAVDYVMRVVVLPPAYGIRRVVERDAYTCQNPRCRCRTLRVHPHHMHQRRHGGSDEPGNIVSTCPCCHLRFIHSDRMSVVRIDDWLVWSWASGGIVIMDSPVADLVCERRPRRSRAKEPHAGVGDRNQL
jgi:hypothetical protein